MRSECQHNYNCGTRTTTTRKSVKMLSTLVTLFVFIMVSTMTDSAHGQRRPSMSPGMEAYRNRWLAYLKAQSTTAAPPPRFRLPPSKVIPGGGSHSVGVRNGNEKPLVVNGFECERTYAFFPNHDDPRMYHFCARSRENWVVYHYFCPQGAVFNEGMRKCMHERGDNAPGGNSNVPARRPGNVPPRRVTHPYRRPTVVPSTTRRTTTSTTTPTTTTTTTTEEPESVPEPDSDHTEVTEAFIPSLSSEEVSTEEGSDKIDVEVSVPGQSSESIKPSQRQKPPQILDETEDDQATRKVNNEAAGADDQVNMIIPESVNGPSRLVEGKSSTTTTPPPPSTSASSSPSTKQKPSKRQPTKAAKIASSEEIFTSTEVDDGAGETSTLSEITAAGGRRPRILKKKKEYWRNFLLGKLY